MIWPNNFGHFCFTLTSIAWRFVLHWRKLVVDCEENMNRENSNVRELPALKAEHVPRSRAGKPIRTRGKYTEAERLAAAQAAGWNVFKFPAKLLLVDLLTDSGTTKLTAYQRSQMERAHGRETYAGSEGYFLLLRRIE